MPPGLVALALVVAALAGGLVGRHFLRVSLAAWCMAHPSALAVLRAALDLDRFHADVRRTVEAALATGEPLYVVASSEHQAQGFARDHDLPPDLVRTVTSPHALRGLHLQHVVKLVDPDDSLRAEQLAAHVAHAVHRADGDLVEHPHTRRPRRRAVLLSPGEYIVRRLAWHARLDEHGRPGPLLRVPTD